MLSTVPVSLDIKSINHRHAVDALVTCNPTLIQMTSPPSGAGGDG